jgi:signal transduction histidine kinase
MRRITSRFVALIATAAVGPLIIYGAVSVAHLKQGTQASVIQGNRRVAQQVAEQIGQYIVHDTRILRSIGLELRATGLEPWLQSRILKDYVLDFPEFREVSLFETSGQPLATSRPGAARLRVPEPNAVAGKDVYIAPLRVDDDLLPTTTIAVRIKPNDEESAWVVGEIALEELWRTVDRIRVGQQGYALVVSEKRVIAHGNPDRKRYIATGTELPGHELVERVETQNVDQDSLTYRHEDGTEMLGVAARVPDLNWTVIVEQPTSEAFAIASQLRRQLLAAIAIALLGTVILGWFWGRSFITRIFALTRATRAIAEGRMDERVEVGGRDEIQELGTAFNSMADRLVELQEDVRKQERQAMFGRIAAGLVHDLSHPIQNIGNSCKLIQRMFDDLEYRDTFKRTVEREMVIIKRVLDDLRNIARPIPLERFPVEMNRAIAETVESMMPHAETAGITLRTELAAEPAFIDGDVFALGRVFRNLILNAIQATAPGGVVGVATEADAERVRIRVYDTGCGIPADRLGAVFEDFVTTKRRGLGLGLAISKKIVEQLGGQITVASEVGKGTTFALDFPRTRARPIALAAG